MKVLLENIKQEPWNGKFLNFSSDQYSSYESLKSILKKNGFSVNPYRDIQYGIQFLVFKNDSSFLLRIYASKKGVRLDLSQCKDSYLRKEIMDLIAQGHTSSLSALPQKKKEKKDAEIPLKKDPDHLIGVDESGKGDYFGPLVVAGVYVTPETSQKLQELQVMDSKLLNDFAIQTIAPYIRELCPFSMIIMKNPSYNDVYSQMQNLNHMLAWAHARVIKSLYEKTGCQSALSDKFDQKSLIQSALYNQGLSKIDLEERIQADSSSIAVSAASILARDAFLSEMRFLSEKFNIALPKGSSSKVLKTANEFVKQYGKDDLIQVAKLHFSLTYQIVG